MKTIKFYTLGCKVNQYDTQAIREHFISAGFQELEDHKPADVYVINTCTVTHKADAESLNFIRKAKRENQKAKIIVTGCLTELDSNKISEIEGIYHIVKNKDRSRIRESIVKLGKSNGHCDINENYDQGGISYFKGHTRAFLKVQDGCNNFCSYCKVPFVRGQSRTRALNDILAEANRLVYNGYKEIVLCGVCLGSYGKDLAPKNDLVDLIDKLENINGLMFIRLSSIEPTDVTYALINKMSGSKKICAHLHIPLQSGDDKILKNMNRNYSGSDYLNLILRLKKNIPDFSLTTDVLVGFPQETEERFQNTLKLIKEVLPLKVHIFPYSPRRGTQAAAKFNHQSCPKIIKERIARLRGIAKDCSLKFKKQFLGRDMRVLIENRCKENPEFWQGHTGNFLKIMLKSNLDTFGGVLLRQAQDTAPKYTEQLRSETPPFSTRKEHAALSINPEQTPAFRSKFRRIDLRNKVILVRLKSLFQDSILSDYS